MQTASFASPDAEIAALRALLAERDAALAERDARLLNSRLEIEKLKIQLARARREQFGQSSERLTAEIGQLEMLIGDLEEDQAQVDAATKQRSHPPQDRPRQRPIRKPLPEHLPREAIVHEPVLACRCGCTDPARLTRLGEDVTEVLDKIPARLKVIRHVRPRYACRMWWSRNMSTACRCIGFPASWPARVSRSSGRPWPTGLATPPGGCAHWPRRSAATPWRSR